MAYVDAEYIQKYDSGDILVWPCVVETGSGRFYHIDEFQEQSEGKPFEELPDWTMLEEEWVEADGKMWYALKEREFNDFYMYSEAEGDSIIEEQYGDEVVVLFNDDDIPV